VGTGRVSDRARLAQRPPPNTPCNRATVQLLSAAGPATVAWLRSCSRGRARSRRPDAPGRLLASRTQLQKMRRFWNGHFDLNRGRGSFSSPLHPYPLAAGSHPHGGSSTRPDLPSIQIFAATPLHFPGLRLCGSHGFPLDASPHHPPCPGIRRYTATRAGRVEWRRPRRSDA
jgi:hypothetical protein